MNKFITKEEGLISNTSFIQILKLRKTTGDFEPNLSMFREAVKSYAFRHYGNLALIFDDIKYFEFITPKIKNGYNENDAGDVMEFKYECERFYKDKSSYEENKRKLFADIWSRMSEESKSEVRSKPEIFPHNCKCVLKLWTAILNTHVFETHGIKEVDLYLINKNIYNMKMNSDEDIFSYYDRIKEQIMCSKEASVTFTEKHEAALFICTLNENYCEFKADLYNDVKNGVQIFPETLHNAFNKASNYVVTNKSKKKSTSSTENDNVTILVTAALAEIKKKTAAKDAAKKNALKDPNKKEEKNSGSKFNNGTVPPTRPCKWCKISNLTEEEKMHYDSNCPRLELINQLIDKGNDAVKSALTATTFTSHSVNGEDNAYCRATLEP
jgi:hypothetical protein